MPNHVTNKLTVTGPECNICRMKNAVCGREPLDAQRIIPMPFPLSTVSAPNDDKELAAAFQAEYGAPDWYHWCHQNWGTKWGFYEVEEWKHKREFYEFSRSREIKSDSIRFLTAWSPPLPLIREIARNFPQLTLTLEYIDEGMGFAGEFTVTGDVENDDCFEDHNSSEFKKIQEILGFNLEEV